MSVLKTCIYCFYVLTHYYGNYQMNEVNINEEVYSPRRQHDTITDI